MTSKLTYIYGIFLVISLGIMIFMGITLSNDVYDPRTNTGYTQMDEYEADWVEDSSLPCGGYDRILMKMPNSDEGDNKIIFYVIHQSVEVYIDGEKVYSVYPSEKNLIGKTPGRYWNAIPTFQKDRGKSLEIRLIPSYYSSKGVIPEISFGSQLTYYLHVIQKEGMILLMSIVAILIGISFSIFTLYTYRHANVDRGLFMLGLFSFWIGLWKLTDLESLFILINDPILLSNITILSLLMALIPFILFVKKLFHNKNNRIWTIICCVCYLIMTFILGLQILDLYDVRQTLILNHLCILVIALTVIFHMVRELIRHGWSRKMKTTAICMFACLIGSLVDIGIHYAYRGRKSSGFGMSGLLVYIIILGVYALKETKKLLRQGQNAKIFKHMAYHDELTGVYSRAAYMNLVRDIHFVKEGTSVVMCDLNNLKQCNDTKGHQAGDRYLKESARLIQSVFDGSGNCYRMGGDEFCVVMQDTDKAGYLNLIGRLKDACEAYNKENPTDFPMSIACGGRTFDPEKDYDIGDTLRRADKSMYRDKMDMKERYEYADI